MPNNSPAPVRDDTDIDPRVARTTAALGRALIELIQERDYRDITVQAILDRAGVGRTTFYAHFRNREDVLHSSYERLFTMFDTLLDRPLSGGPRLFPVAEFLAHIEESGAVLGALRRAGRLDDAWALCAGHAARTIERRMDRWPGSTSTLPRPLVARMLAGALMEAIQWWQLRPASATPAEMDAAFHEFARGVLLRPRP